MPRDLNPPTWDELVRPAIRRAMGIPDFIEIDGKLRHADCVAASKAGDGPPSALTP